MQISQKGLDLVKRYEGLILEAYKCPAGVWTIGYGHTHQVKRDDVINETMALEFLKQDIRHAQKAVSNLVTVELMQNQIDALVSFVFNIGVTNFKKSTLLKMLNAGNFNAATNQFSRWNKARVSGKLTPLAGLTNRRAHEAELFASYQHYQIARSVFAPSQKTKLTSKTNIASGLGIVSLLFSQAEGAQQLLKKAADISVSGGDIADQIGSLTNRISWPVAAMILAFIVFVYIIFERNKKLTQDGV